MVVDREGIYKVKVLGKHHRMKVYREKGKLVYSISACPPRPIEDFEQYVEVMGLIHDYDPVLHAKLTVSWKDQFEDLFEEQATSTARFRQILDSIPDVLDRLKDKPWKPT